MDRPARLDVLGGLETIGLPRRPRIPRKRRELIPRGATTGEESNACIRD